MAIESERLLTVKEVAERLRLHPITVRRLIASGRLPAVRIGRAVRVREGDVSRIASPEPGLRAREVTAQQLDRARQAARRLIELRDQKSAYGEAEKASRMTTEEMIRQERRMLARKHDRWRKPFDEMKKLRDQMAPMDISTAELVRLARSAREWMYQDDAE